MKFTYSERTVVLWSAPGYSPADFSASASWARVVPSLATPHMATASSSEPVNSATANLAPAAAGLAATGADGDVAWRNHSQRTVGGPWPKNRYTSLTHELQRNLDRLRPLFRRRSVADMPVMLGQDGL